MCVGFRCEEVGFVESNAELSTTLFNRRTGERALTRRARLGVWTSTSDESSRHNHVQALFVMRQALP